jgi:hypothetical protein
MFDIFLVGHNHSGKTSGFLYGYFLYVIMVKGRRGIKKEGWLAIPPRDT